MGVWVEVGGGVGATGRTCQLPEEVGDLGHVGRAILLGDAAQKVARAHVGVGFHLGRSRTAEGSAVKLNLVAPLMGGEEQGA